MDMMIEATEFEKSEEQIYPMNGIKIDKGFYTVFELKRRYDNEQKRIILDSDFQRDFVWKHKRKAELIESVLMGLPLPNFYFSQDKYGRLIVIDGRQRLTALFEFMDNSYRLSGLKILTQLNHMWFSDLSPVLKGRLEDYQIQAHVIMPPTPDRIKFDIFDRVNRGGVQLTKQEIRNALYQGEATKLLTRLAESEEFRLATGNAFVKEQRMKDKYLLNRFIAFYLYRMGHLQDTTGQTYIYLGDMEELLGKSLDAVNHMTLDAVAKIEWLVKETLKKIYLCMGEDAFRMSFYEKRQKTPINMNIFETVMYAFLFIDLQELKACDLIKIEIGELINSEQFHFNIQSHRDSAARLGWRLDSAETLGRSINKYD